MTEVSLPERRPEPVINCSFPYCDQLVGGTQWDPVGCTMAFYVGPAGVYDPYMLSAGHCNSGLGASWTTCNHVGSCPATLGYQTNIYLGGAPAGDGMLLRNTAGMAIYPGYFNWSVNGLSTVRGYYAYDSSRADIGNAPVGTIVCKNGARSRTTCGDIADNNTPFTQSGTNASFTHMLRINACSGRGDSGAPWTAASQEVAIGVQSSAYVLADGSCDTAFSTSFAEPIGRALYMTGVSIYGY